MNIAPFTYGVSVGWPSSAIPQLSSVDNPIGIEPITTEDGSWLGGIVCIGALAALPVYSIISERFGRKLANYLIGVPFVIGWFLTYMASSVRVLYVARFIIGLGSGGMLLVTPLYVGEISQDDIRGTLGSFLLLFLNSGMFASYILGAYVSFHAYAVSGVIFSSLYLAANLWLPESPVYLLTKDKHAEALVSLKQLRGDNNQLAEHELEALTRTIAESKETTKATIKDVLSSKISRLGLIIGVVLCTNQQFCGIFAVQSYIGNIFQSSGSDLSPEMAAIIVGAIQVVGSSVSSLLMDRAGRKFLIIVSNTFMAFSLVSIGIYFYLKSVEASTDGLNWLPVTALSIFVLSFALGMGPVPFVMLSEILSPQTKGLITWISITSLWLCAFIVGKFFSTISNAVGIHICFWFFALVCIAGTVFHVLILPETKNKSLEVILKELGGRKKRKENNDHI